MRTSVARAALIAAALALLLALPVVLVACGTTGKGLKVGLAYAAGGPGDHGFNDLALAGLTKAQHELSGQVGNVRALTARRNETEDDQYDRLDLLCKAGYNPVIAVGFSYAGRDPATGPMARAAKNCPKTRFAIIDDDSVAESNVADLVFANEQGSYLMGAAAALKTTTGAVGFVGACPVPLVQQFLAGYQAGVRSVRADMPVYIGYVGADAGHCDFTDTAPAQSVAAGLYDQGAGVVFQVAGGAGIGVFRAAAAIGRKAIGVDADQYDTVPDPLRPVILTSMIKRVDVAVYDFIKTVAADRFQMGVRRYDLADDGLSFATSGGQINDITARLDEDRKKIVAGQIVVPTIP
jgi:basic membrane protein A and related proteins